MEAKAGARPQNAWNYQQLEGQGRSIPLGYSQREHTTPETLILDFWPTELKK